MTQAYIGTKIIAARPQEKDGAPGYAIRYPDGYESWCPETEFERCYRPVSDEEGSLIGSYGTGHSD